jgi:signal transduction histidine kinase
LQSIENAIYYLENECVREPQCPFSQKAKEMLHAIDSSISYADKIIRDLQDFSATRAPALTKTDINTFVKETLSEVKLPEHVTLRTEFGQLSEINVDQDQMKRVFLNLTTNAIQAMEDRGTLTISTKQTAGFAEISFADTGTGISKENIKKLFTPLFTTKAKGMGMGLPICKKFVENHKGSIQVQSEDGKGTTFTVKIPITQISGGENH